MIYLDASVALAEILVEDRRPDPALWAAPLVSSQLLRYEIWSRVHTQGLAQRLGASVAAFTSRVDFVELRGPAMQRALEPFPQPVRTLDALHLAAMDYLRESGYEATLASYDRRMLEVARAMGFAVIEP